MPQQQFVLSYLIHPAKYEEVGGVEIPFSFSIADKEGYVFSYSPFALWNGLKMNSILGERTQDSVGELPLEVRAERRIQKDSLIERYFPLASDETIRASVDTYEFLLSEVVKEQESTVHLLLDYSLKARGYGEISNTLDFELIRKNWDADINLITEATSDRPQHESFVEQVSIGDEVVKLKDAAVQDLMPTTDRPHIAHESRINELVVLSETKDYKDSLIASRQVYADELEKRIAMVDKDFRTGKRNPRLEAAIVSQVLVSRSIKLSSILKNNMVLVNREKYNTRVIQKVLQMTRESKGMKVIHKVMDTARDGRGAQVIKKYWHSLKDGHSSYNKTHIKFSVKDGHGAKIDARVILSLFVPKDFLAENHKVIDADKRPVNTHFFDERVLAVYHSPEVLIHKSLMIMDKAGIVTQFLDAIEADVKEARESIITKVMSYFDRGYHQGEWIEKTIYSIANGHEAFIDRLIELGDDINRETIMHLLKECDIPDREGLVQEIYQAWNENRENRPAGEMRVAPLAHWEIGFDDLFDTWDEGWDYLDPPNKDYNYEKHKAEMYDSNGVPLEPLSPINVPDVEVKMPVNHPMPEYAEVGSKEAWVELYTFQDVTIMIATDWKRNMARYAEMNGHKALQESLKKLYDSLQEQTNWDEEYQRMFRYVRWQAERIAHQDSVTVLHRTYDDWRDRIIANGGIFTYPHEANQFRVQSTGTIESASTVGDLSFELENYIDGTMTFSSIISTGSQSSTSVLRFYIDGELIHTFTAADGVQRLSFDVPMGVHQYRWEYEAEVGDTVKLSGIQVSGVQFIEAVTTQKDAGSLRGVAAINHLVQALLSYYATHHKGKSKGAMGVYQRKIWLS